jgi:hypothetical protein
LVGDSDRAPCPEGGRDGQDGALATPGSMRVHV